MVVAWAGKPGGWRPGSDRYTRAQKVTHAFLIHVIHARKANICSEGLPDVSSCPPPTDGGAALQLFPGEGARELWAVGRQPAPGRGTAIQAEHPARCSGSGKAGFPRFPENDMENRAACRFDRVGYPSAGATEQ
jgi:hypothetical protein